MSGNGNILFGGAGGGGGSAGPARNGLSVDAGGFVVLGQEPGAGGDPAKLLDDRQVPMEGFAVTFEGSTGAVVEINDDHLEEGGLDSPDSYQGWIGTPNNYGTAYAGHGEADRFYGATWERFNGVNSYPRPNVVGQFWSYNMDPGSSLYNGAESGFGFRTETDFDLNGLGFDVFEFHLPQVVLANGLAFRPWSMYMEKSNGITQLQSQIQNYNFNTLNEDETYFAWTCVTSGSNPGEDRQNHLTLTARGEASLSDITFTDQDATFAPLLLQWDRGSAVISLGGAGSSVNNWGISVIGNIVQTGNAAAGTSFYQVTTQGIDQQTTFSCQLFADTFNNNPTYLFDRRLASGSLLIGDGNNGGEVTWGNDRNANVSGIANGVYDGGTETCFDVVIASKDTDSAIHNQAVFGRNGNTTLRGGLQTGDPGSGAALWELGQQHAAAVTVNLTQYVEVNIGGAVVKLAICN